MKILGNIINNKTTKKQKEFMACYFVKYYKYIVLVLKCMWKRCADDIGSYKNDDIASV